MKAMLQEEHVVDGQFQAAPLSEQMYARQYKEEAKSLKQTFIKGALQFLEQQYARVIKNQISAKPLLAKVGPVPAFRNSVKAYLNVKYNRANTRAWPTDLEVLDDFPIWAQIYYCMRCGNLTAASELVKEHAYRLGNFPLYFEEYVHNEGRLSDARWNELIHEYKLCRSNSDPYKLVLYALIGRCELNKSFPNVLTTTQDFMWFKLHLVRESDQPLQGLFANYDYPLARLQQLLLEYGSAHFSRNGKVPLLYFQVLLMSQQFERAIQYLAGFEQYQVEAVHFAIALYYYGVLRQPVTQKRELVDQQQQPVIDFVRLLRGYVGAFSTTDPVDALQYLNLINQTSSSVSPLFGRERPLDSLILPQSASLRDLAIKDLLLETREFDLLLGDGNKPGKIVELLSREEARTITELAATDSDINGRYDDAIRLFELAENYDRVLEILNTQLTRVLAVRSTPAATATPPSTVREQNDQSRDRARLAEIARYIYQKHQQTNILLQVRNKNLLKTFEMVLHLVYFFDLYHSGRYEEALKNMEDLGIIPFDIGNVDKKVEAFKYLDANIKKNFADVLLATMDILYKLFGNLKNTYASPSSFAFPPSFADGGRDQKMQEIRLRARAIVMFSGMIQYKMPGDTNARLMRMEVFMS